MTQEDYQVITVLQIKSKMAAAKKQCFLRFLYIKGTNGRQKTHEIFHVYSIFYSGFRCQTTVIFGITKDGSLALNTLAS